jgi:two-component system sensor histidine kinase YesM
LINRFTYGVAVNSIRNKLMVLFVSSVALLLSLVGIASYRWTRGVAERRISESTVLTLAQIDRNMETMFGSVHDISLFLIANRNVRGYLRSASPDGPGALLFREYLNDDLANLVASKSFILSVNVYGEGGFAYESGGPSRIIADGTGPYREPAIPPSGELVKSGTYTRHYQALGNRRVISFYRQLNDPNRLTRRIGTMRIDLDEAAVAALHAQKGPGSRAYGFACDEDGRVLTHPDAALIGRSLASDPVFSRAFAAESGYYRVRIDGVDTLITHYPSPRGTMVSVRPFQELVDDSGESLLFSVGLFLLATAVAAALAWWIATTMTTPIKALAEGMKKVEDGEFGAEVAASGTDEIGRLGVSFNRMSARIRTLIDEVYKIEIIKKEAELKALQAQINPHFLYNTLDVIYWTAKMEGSSKTAQAVHALSRLFKLGLNKGEELTRLGTELDHLRCYLAIQNLRYDEPPEILIDVDQELEDCVTTKLVLQPLVENAFLHGIADLDHRGRIEIVGRRVGADVVLTVEDNGVGMDEARRKKVLDTDVSGARGFGVKNVDQSIKLFFGPEYGLSLESRPEAGTRATVRLPFRTEGGNGRGA